MTVKVTLKAEVRSLLRYGKKNARTGENIARVLGFKKDRTIRLAIREMTAEGLPIASSVTPPLGYFIASSQAEATHYINVLTSRLVNDAYRRRDFKRAARVLFEPYQTELSLGWKYR